MVLRRCMVGMAVLIVLSSLLQIIPSPGRGVRAAEPNDPERSTIIVDASGGGDYTCIQWAIDNASDGDSIIVENGIYNENVIVNKRVELTGLDNEKTIIDAGGNGNGIVVTIDNVHISGFNITNCGYAYSGIKVYSCTNVTIDDNRVNRNSGYGISISGGDNITVSNNNCVLNTRAGISTCWSKDIIIYENRCISNGYGVDIESSEDIRIYNNSCNLNIVDGIYMSSVSFPE